ncbi:hypothetical protein [Synechococcus sp. MIT S9504]|uniref:hypothetical protein n=1 Tax=Synechococcus sp. MIT S9504 TaxID=1801628 RepID=UPI00082B969B|nr:hypothetical protein [Synechococcus sp. MIT S9504]
MAEVSIKLVGVNHKKDFVIDVGSDGWLVEAGRGHGFILNECELVMQLGSPCQFRRFVMPL